MSSKQFILNTSATVEHFFRLEAPKNEKAQRGYNNLFPCGRHNQCRFKENLCDYERRMMNCHQSLLFNNQLSMCL